jgi:hypothetical protein
MKEIARAARLEKTDHALAAESREAINRSRQRLNGHPDLQQQLEQADRHLRKGAQRIGRQRAVVIALGQPATTRRLLRLKTC